MPPAPEETAAPNNNNKKKTSDKFYCCKAKDALLCEELQSIVARFIKLDALKELAHGLGTCANKSFNNTVSWLAPKNKVYSGTCSLTNRVNIALDITTIGTLKYYKGLFNMLSIQMIADIGHYLTVVGQKKKSCIQEKRKTQEYDRLKKETAEATKACKI